MIMGTCGNSVSEEESTSDSKWRGEAVPGIGGWKYPLILYQSNLSDGEEKENKLIERERAVGMSREKKVLTHPLFRLTCSLGILPSLSL